MSLLDPHPDLSLVPIPELGKIRRARIASGRQYVHRYRAGQRGHLLVEPVQARDLERDQPDFPWPRGNGQRALDPPDLQHVDGAGAEGDGPADRDGVDQPAVEVVGASISNGGSSPGTAQDAITAGTTARW